MDSPCILIMSTQKGKASELARDMDAKFMADGSDGIKYYSMDIDNKYYSAKVTLCTTETFSVGISVEGIEAVILHYVPSEEEPQNLDEYVPLIQSLSDAEVLLLACQAFPDAQKRDEVWEWCHIHKFELVDMESQEPTDHDDDMDQEKYGIERIIEALHTHTWPNRILKGLPSGRISTSTEPDVSQIEDQLDNIRLNSIRDGTEHMLMESVLDGIMGEENADFGELFGQLMAMKEHAAALSPSNRRAAAEQLVTAFWKAMVGDPAEVEGLDDE